MTGQDTGASREMNLVEIVAGLAPIHCARKQHEQALELLREAQLGKGRFDRDALTHAGNVIEDMMDLVARAIALLTER